MPSWHPKLITTIGSLSSFDIWSIGRTGRFINGKESEISVTFKAFLYDPCLFPGIPGRWLPTVPGLPWTEKITNPLPWLKASITSGIPVNRPFDVEYINFS